MREEEFQKILHDLDKGMDEEREDAAFRLGAIGDKRAVKPLLNHLKGEPYASITKAIVWAVGEIGDESAVPKLLELSEQKTDIYLKKHYAGALLRIGKSIKNKKVEEENAKALQLVYPSLRENDNEKVIIPAMKEALKMISGKRVKNPNRYLELYVKQLRAMHGKMK